MQPRIKSSVFTKYYSKQRCCHSARRSFKRNIVMISFLNLTKSQLKTGGAIVRRSLLRAKSTVGAGGTGVKTLLSKHPLVANCVTYGLLYSGSEFLQQTIIRHHGFISIFKPQIDRHFICLGEKGTQKLTLYNN